MRAITKIRNKIFCFFVYKELQFYFDDNTAWIMAEQITYFKFKK